MWIADTFFSAFNSQFIICHVRNRNKKNKRISYVIKHHAMKTYGEVEVQIHA